MEKQRFRAYRRGVVSVVFLQETLLTLVTSLSFRLLMPFTLLPVLARMREVYQEPPPTARFSAYLHLLQGDTRGDLAVPVQHFNPMAKAALVTRLEELLAMQAEQVIADLLPTLTPSALPQEPLLQVALNLADDAQGGWTNRYTTDFANKFNLSALIKRGFCTPLLWSSEAFSPALLERRTHAQAWRSRYQLAHPLPRTLAEHVAQETYVARHMAARQHAPSPATLAIYQEYQAAADTATLLAFFYGDEAAIQLGHPPLGSLALNAGFAFAHALAYS